MSDEPQKHRLSFDDPKPVREKRVIQQIFLLPSLKKTIDVHRGKISRSEWIEHAIRAYLKSIGS